MSLPVCLRFRSKDETQKWMSQGTHPKSANKGTHQKERHSERSLPGGAMSKDRVPIIPGTSGMIVPTNRRPKITHINAHNQPNATEAKIKNISPETKVKISLIIFSCVAKLNRHIADKRLQRPHQNLSDPFHLPQNILDPFRVPADNH